MSRFYCGFIVNGVGIDFQFRNRCATQTLGRNQPKRCARLTCSYSSTAPSSAANSRPFGNWSTAKTSDGIICDVLVPNTDRKVRGIVHFIGGAGLSSTPRAAYAPLLEDISAATDCVVITTPIPVSLDHISLSKMAATSFTQVKTEFLPQVFAQRANSVSDLSVFALPVFGLGHSLGAKLHVIMGSDSDTRGLGGVRVANLLVSYNNFSAEKSIPALSQLRDGIRFLGMNFDSFSSNTNSNTLNMFKNVAQQVLGSMKNSGLVNESVWKGISQQLDALRDLRKENAEFIPSPIELENLVLSKYAIFNNLVVQFQGDQIDQSERLVEQIQSRFQENANTGTRVVMRTLAGTHLTPATPRIDSEAVRKSMRNFGSNTQWLEFGAESAASIVNKQLQDLIVVLSAFIVLQIELYEKRALLSSSSSSN